MFHYKSKKKERVYRRTISKNLHLLKKYSEGFVCLFNKLSFYVS